MPKTTNLGLSLFNESEESSTYFENWSRNLNRNGNGTDSSPLSDMQKIDAEFGRLYGLRGTLTLQASSWNNNSYTVTLPNMTNNDTIFITPADKSSKDALDEANCFVSSNANVLTFVVDITPTVSVNLKYRVMRGAAK